PSGFVANPRSRTRSNVSSGAETGRPSIGIVVAPRLPGVERGEVGRAHLGAEPLEGPRPHRRDPAIVEVPAPAPRDPDRLRGGDGTVGLEALEGVVRRADLAAVAVAEPVEELDHVRQLELGDLDER